MKEKKNLIIKKRIFFNKKYKNKKNFKLIKYDFKFIYNFLEKKKIRFNNVKIADVGCANGSFLYFLKNNYPNNFFHGIDTDKQLIRLNKNNPFLKKISFLNKSILKKFSKNKYNVITCLGTLNLFDDQEFLLNNLLSHLYKRGFLILNCYLNKNNIDVNVNYKKYFKNSKNLSNAIYFKSYQKIKKFFLKKNLLRFFIISNPYPYKINKSYGLNIYTKKINKKNVRFNDLNIFYDQYLIVAQKK